MGAVRIPIDTKSMRILSETDTVVAVVEFATEIGTAVVNFTGDSRVLVKLT